LPAKLKSIIFPKIGGEEKGQQNKIVQHSKYFSLFVVILPSAPLSHKNFMTQSKIETEIN
jgi:hypothetical protein